MFSDFHIHTNSGRYKYPLFVDGKQVYGCSFLFEWDEPFRYYEFGLGGYYDHNLERIDQPEPSIMRVWLTIMWKNKWVKYREVTGHKLLAMDAQGVIYEYDGETATMTKYKDEEEE